MNSFGLKLLIVLQFSSSFLHAGSFDAERDVKFLLRVKNRAFKDEEVFRFEAKHLVKSSAFDPSKPTTFLVHGFGEDGEIKYNEMMSK